MELGLLLLLARPVRAGNSSIFTVSAWVKPEGSVASKAIVAKAEELRMFTNASGYLGCQIKSTSWQTAAQASSNALPLNSWSFVACTYDKTNLKVFVNGVQVASQALTATVDDTANALKYGVDDSASSPYGAFQGTIDEMKFYNYARTEKQIVEDMNAGHPAVGSPVGSPVAYWKFDEGYGTTVYNSGSGGMSLNGTLGTGSSAPRWTNDGKFGKALSFDGSNDYVSTGTGFANFQENTPFSISVWIRTKSSSSQSIVAKWKATVSPGWRMDMTSGKIRFFLSNANGGAGRWIQTDSTYNNNLWQHIVGVYDGSGSANGLKIYVNGIVAPTTIILNTSPGTLSDTPIYIGATDASSPTLFFNGLIDEVKIYNYALSEDEIKAEYNRGATMVLGSLSDTSGLTGGSVASNSASAEYCVPGDTATCAPPVARWDFEEKTGQYAYDTSGNGNTGTLTNGPRWKSSGECKKGSCLEFNHINSQYVVANDSPSLSLTSALTLEAWVYWNGNTSNYAMIINKENSYELARNNGSGEIWYAFWGPTDGGGSMWRVILTGYSLTANQWTHLALTFAGSNVYLYANGRRVYSNTGVSGTITDQTTTFRVAGREATSQYWPGRIDHVSVYNYARTPAQIAWDYNRGKPVAYYKLDECAGTTIHSTNDPYNSSLDATLTIGASGSQTSAGTCASGNSTDAWYNGSNGKFNSSLNFDGTDDRATTGNIALIAAASQTYSNVSWGAWVKASSNQTSKTIIHKSSEFRLYTDSNGYPTCQVGDTGNTAAASSALPNNTWSHLLCTYDGSNIKLYINGTLVASNSRTGTITSSSSTNINIAQKSDSSQRYGGQIDEVKIWNYALTSVLVENEYNQGAGIRFGPESGMP